MGSAAGNLKDVTELIHLAIAPIFLLTGVAATLTVFAGRLARIVDRGRFLENHTPLDRNRRVDELRALEKRAHLIYRALSLGVCSALCVCLLMTLVFAGPLFDFNTAKPVAFLFLLSLFTYTAALGYLMREVFLALGSFSLGIHDVVDSSR